MKITFWGVRGSTACGCTDTVRYGGNTACMHIALHNHTIILDAGSGLRQLGGELVQQHDYSTCDIYLSHGHWDHVMGLPFFAPLYTPGWTVNIFASGNIGSMGLEPYMHRLFDTTFFPVAWDALPNKPHLHTLSPDAWHNTPYYNILPTKARHCAGAVAYRIECQGQSVFYGGDHELGDGPFDYAQPYFTAMHTADIAIVDAQYLAADYADKKGWGHSAMAQWPDIAKDLQVNTLVLTHFDPMYTDTILDAAAERLNDAAPDMQGRILLAYEGLELTPTTPIIQNISTQASHCCNYCDASEDLAQTTDISQTFDALLTKARAMTHADAGTLYLIEDDALVFSYSHNETLFTASQWSRQQYLNARLPIDAKSIAGFVAYTGTILNIPDVRALAPDVPYSFNESFDKATGYRTVSMCVLPLRSLNGQMVGVIQLINAKDGAKKDGNVVPFTSAQQHMLEKLCTVGAQAIARGLGVRDMILRMLQTSALRDPTETAGHVMRVGAMTAELYHCLAEKRGVDIAEINAYKAQLRLAAMLHDVGKVGISDLILKKPGKLEPEERAAMERHCCMGAQLFQDTRFDMDVLARDIALHHHQKWDGTGYTGDSEHPPLAGEAIPLGARLTSITDVFDALVSPRSYKEPWPVAKAVSVLQADAGTHFDPEAVEAFVEIQDTMVAIRDKYKES